MIPVLVSVHWTRGLSRALQIGYTTLLTLRTYIDKERHGGTRPVSVCLASASLLISTDEATLNAILSVTRFYMESKLPVYATK